MSIKVERVFHRVEIILMWVDRVSNRGMKIYWTLDWMNHSSTRRLSKIRSRRLMSKSIKRTMKTRLKSKLVNRLEEVFSWIIDRLILPKSLERVAIKWFLEKVLWILNRMR